MLAIRVNDIIPPVNACFYVDPRMLWCILSLSDSHEAKEIEMTEAAIQAIADNMYAQLVAWQEADEVVCMNWYAAFSAVSDAAYEQTRSA